MTSVALLDALTEAVGSAHVLTDADLKAGYEVDWTRRWGRAGTAAAVVRPGSTAEVAAVVAACDAAGAAVVAQGGNTGLVGASVPRLGPTQRLQVVLSTRRLDQVGEIDLTSATVSCGAGAVLAEVQAAAARHGLEFAVDLGARDSATIGAMVATNAGGVHVLRHGPMAAQVVRLEAVLADGSVVGSPRGPVKDNTGYRWGGILCGSEGTLAIVTAVQLRLVPAAAPDERLVAVYSVDDFDAATCLCGRARRLRSIRAAEAMDAPALALVCDHLATGPPLDGDIGVLVLLEGAEADLASLAEAPEARRSAVATDPPSAARLWRYREAIPEAIASRGVPHKLDVSIPAAATGRFVTDVRRVADDVVVFGHLGDGNLHVNVLGVAAADERIDAEVFGLAAGAGGSIGAEHGVGVAKAGFLPLAHSPADIAAMTRLKVALDPNGTLNPGAVLPQH